MTGKHGSESQNEWETGKFYDWSQQKVRKMEIKFMNLYEKSHLTIIYLQKRPNVTKCGATFLEMEIEFATEMESEKCDIPKRTDGTEYNIEDLRQDQKEILLYVIAKLKKWLEKKKLNKVNNNDYLRMLIQGKAGSGKSTFIKTLVTILRRMFGFQNVVIISAPTGNAAFGAGGKTINRTFSCSIGITFQKLGEKSEEKLLKNSKQHFFDI